MDKENIFFWRRRKERKYLKRENTFCGGEEEQRRKRKENILEEGKFMRDGLTGIKGSARNPRRSKNTVINSSYERRDIGKQMFIAKSAIQKIFAKPIYFHCQIKIFFLQIFKS